MATPEVTLFILDHGGNPNQLTWQKTRRRIWMRAHEIAIPDKVAQASVITSAVLKKGPVQRELHRTGPTYQTISDAVA
jgi:hypothetical protein